MRRLFDYVIEMLFLQGYRDGYKKGRASGYSDGWKSARKDFVKSVRHQ